MPARRLSADGKGADAPRCEVTYVTEGKRMITVAGSHRSPGGRNPLRAQRGEDEESGTPGSWRVLTAARRDPAEDLPLFGR
ncbi:hypothetical protein ACE1SV_70700 [Streptomyces sp. E-15]